MDHLQTFVFEGNQIRTVMVNDVPFFVGKDVCDVLEISAYRDALARLDYDERASVIVDTPGGRQSMLAVNEFGLYNLVLTSRKPEAKQFKRWITHEVIPSIRKTGAYAVPSADVIPLDERQVRMQLLRSALEHEERLETVEQRVAAVERKVDEQITLDSGEQRALQKAIARKVYDIALDDIGRRSLFQELYREIKDRWAVPSYKDVRRSELDEVLRYIEAWRPRRVA